MRSGVSDVECARGRAGAPLGEGLVSTSLTKRGTSVVDLLSPSLFEGEVLAEDGSRLSSCEMRVGIASTLSIKSSRGLRGSRQSEARVLARSLGSTQIECLFFCFLAMSWASRGSRQTECRILAEVGSSRAPSYKESLDRGASPTTGLRGDDGRGQAHEPRREGEEAKDEEPPDPEVLEAEVEVLNLLEEVTEDGGVAMSVSQEPRSASASKENLWCLVRRRELVPPGESSHTESHSRVISGVDPLRLY